jgi:uncharacterized protein (TIGR03435 family)
LKESALAAQSAPPATDVRIVTAGGHVRMTAQAATMADLANYLANQLDRPVRDETGLQQRYDFSLTFPSEARELSDPFEAMQSQLGLRLEGRKGPVERLVVDRIEKTPADN